MNQPPPKRDPFGLVGSVLDGRYRVDAVVAEGGFGVVYRGLHMSFESPIAIKVLKVPAIEGAERQAFLETFRREGKLLFELSRVHPAFVRANEMGVHLSGIVVAPYLVLEWLDGPSLAADLDARRKAGNPRRSLDEVIALLSPIAEALSLAHDRGIAHRDLKPANVVLAQTPEGVVPKLLDLGIAKVMTESTPTAQYSAPTTTGIGAFTPGYAAPEQWLRKLGATGPWSDVYSFALLCVELLIGKPALQGDDAQQLMGATIDREDRPVPSARGAQVSPVVDAVFHRALAVEPRIRYATMRAFWSELLAAHRHGTAPTPPPSSNQSHQSLHPGSNPNLNAPSAPPGSPSSPSSPRIVVSSAASTVQTSSPTELSAPFPMTTRMGVAGGSAPPARGAPSRAPLAIGLGIALAVGFGVVLALARFTKPRPVKAHATASVEPNEGPKAPPSTTCPADMALVPTATFAMGARDGEADERPVHKVTVHGFCLDKFEMTVARYAPCSASKSCKPANNAASPSPDTMPATGVDYASALAACARLERRLPTEAEWELAARGANSAQFPWSPGPITCERAQVFRVGDTNCPNGVAPVGSHPTGNSPLGISDLAGNVWEWVSDYYGPYRDSVLIDPKGPEKGTLRIVRGGSWAQEGTTARGENRAQLSPTERLPDVGLRCAQGL
jgi:formylglycine-generating enzyme required for sulfatase activity